VKVPETDGRKPRRKAERIAQHVKCKEGSAVHTNKGRKAGLQQDTTRGRGKLSEKLLGEKDKRIQKVIPTMTDCH